MLVLPSDAEKSVDPKELKERISMKVSHALLAAAVSGVFVGVTGCATTAAPAGPSSAGMPGSTTAAAMPAAKHDCKGKNDCKGNGGCKSGNNGCKGKNDCKGQGGCKTDGTKTEPKKTDKNGCGGASGCGSK